MIEEDSLDQFLLNIERDQLTENFSNENPANSSTAKRSDVNVSEEDLEKLKKSRVPINTQRRVNWATKMFIRWHEEWKCRLNGGLKVYKDLHEMTKGDIDFCLQYFIAEIRKADGSMYPPKTYKEIISSFQHYLNNDLGMKCSIFLDNDFQETRKVLDAQMKKSAAIGNVKLPKRSHSISFEDEEQLWRTGTLGSSTPKQLSETLIYELGIHLSLRASKEHRDLEFGENSQLRLCSDSNGMKYIQYIERCSKTRKFGLKTVAREPKVCRIYPNSDKPERCVVALYEKYISKRPESHGLNGHTAFYLTPKKDAVSGSWYKAVPLGIHTIEGTTRRLMCSIENEPDKKKIYTNSSLRRTSQMRLLKAGLPTEVIEKKTGRLSHSATQAYIESEEYEQQMSTALYEKTASNSIINNETSTIPQSLFQGSHQFQNCTFNIHLK